MKWYEKIILLVSLAGIAWLSFQSDPIGKDRTDEILGAIQQSTDRVESATRRLEERVGNVENGIVKSLGRVEKLEGGNKQFADTNERFRKYIEQH